jgi:hypothetical protein
MHHCSRCGKAVNIPLGVFIRQGVEMHSCDRCLMWFATDGKKELYGVRLPSG